MLPSQYQRFRDYQWRPLDVDVDLPDVGDELGGFLSEIVDVFGSETAVSLELMTHRERPWISARGELPATAPSACIISKNSMREYYRALGEDQKDQARA